MKAVSLTYKNHPLTAQSILRRARESRGSLPLTERHLAEDRHTRITDQNHIGGSHFVRQLARDAGIGRRSRVLDLGCGLGGPARLLAMWYGCHVLGVDVSPSRCEDATELTRVVGLQRKVAFLCGDFMRVSRPSEQFDVLWGQGAWDHVDNKNAFMRRWIPSLSKGGRIAFEDSVLRRQPAGKDEVRLLARLSTIWAAYIVCPEDWCGVFHRNGCSVSFSCDLSEEMAIDCSQMLAAIGRLPKYPRSERNGFECALELLHRGVLGYARIVAVKG
jgi:SAM-dependent methyltransferase